MAAARNVSAAARMTDRPSPLEATGQLADGRRLAGAVDADDEHDGRAAGDRANAGSRRGRAATSRAASSVADGGLGTARIAPLAGALDEVDGESGADVAGDERLLDVVPGRPFARSSPRKPRSRDMKLPRVRSRPTSRAASCRRPASARHRVRRGSGTDGLGPGRLRLDRDRRRELDGHDRRRGRLGRERQQRVGASAAARPGCRRSMHVPKSDGIGLPVGVDQRRDRPVRRPRAWAVRRGGVARRASRRSLPRQRPFGPDRGRRGPVPRRAAG